MPTEKDKTLTLQEIAQRAKDAEDSAYWSKYNHLQIQPPKPTMQAPPDPGVVDIDASLDAPPFRSANAQEIQAELPVPDCSCLQSRFAVFVWYNPEAQSANWYTTMTTPIRPVPAVSHCPFCGDALPELVRKNLPEGYPPECYYQTLQK